MWTPTLHQSQRLTWSLCHPWPSFFCLVLLRISVLIRRLCSSDELVSWRWKLLHKSYVRTDPLTFPKRLLFTCSGSYRVTLAKSNFCALSLAFQKTKSARDSQYNSTSWCWSPNESGLFTSILQTVTDVATLEVLSRLRWRVTWTKKFKLRSCELAEIIVEGDVENKLEADLLILWSMHRNEKMENDFLPRINFTKKLNAKLERR